MRFCPRCGSLMMMRNIDGKMTWVCPSCGYREAAEGGTPGFAILKQQIRHSEKERIIVVNDQKKLEALPKTRAICPKCGYHEAYYWVVQTRRADEPPTRFFKCAQCGHVWREYD